MFVTPLRMIQAILFGGIIAVAIPSCLSLKHPPYPQEWPALQKERSTFSGEFCSGVISILQKHEQSNQCDSGKTVFLRLDSSRILWLRYMDSSLINPVEQKFPLTNSVFKIQYKQNKKGLRFIYKTDHLAGNPLLGVDRIYNQLYYAEDGSLIIRSGELSAGLVFMLFPIYISEYAWIRVSDQFIEIRKKSGKHTSTQK